MKSIWFFYIGLGVDAIALLIAVYFMLSDMLKGTRGTNNPTMFGLTLAMAALIAGALLLKNAGRLGLANILLWVPGLPLAGYGLMILMFIIFKPDMR